MDLEQPRATVDNKAEGRVPSYIDGYKLTLDGKVELDAAAKAAVQEDIKYIHIVPIDTF